MVRKSAFIGGLFIIVIFVIFLSGPRVSMVREFNPRVVPEDIKRLDNYLEESESKYKGITEGVARKIVWAQGLPSVTEYSLVYVHGYGATWKELSPVPQQLARRLGANLFLTRLPGHGRGSDPLAEADLSDYRRSVREAVDIGKRIGRKLILLGVSTGAPLVLDAHINGADAQALLLVSPNFAPADPSAWILEMPWGLQIAELVVGGKYRSWLPKNKDHSRYWTVKQPVASLATMVATVKMGRRLALDTVAAPVLVLYTENDKVVSVQHIKDYFAKIGSVQKRIINIAGAKDHLIAGDVLSPQTNVIVCEHMYRFIADIEKSER